MAPGEVEEGMARGRDGRRDRGRLTGGKERDDKRGWVKSRINLQLLNYVIAF